jgi:diketogulonate reductase-like aldo/keto reductase
MSGSATSPKFDLSPGLESRVRLNDGVLMPVLGLGVWQTPAGSATHDAVRHALATGYRLIDTATIYENEEAVGSAIRASGVPREDVFVTTKVWNDDQGFEAALAAFDRSRRALGLSTIDLYLIHWPVPRARTETWRALTRLLREGKCRSIGVSNFTVAHLEELRRESEVVPSVNQVEFSPFLFQSGLLRYCRSHGIQLEAYAPLTRGRRLEDSAVVRVARAHRKSPAQVLIRWGLQHDVVEIPKSARPDRIEENANVFDFEIAPEEMTLLDGLDEGYRTTWDPTRMA